MKKCENLFYSLTLQTIEGWVENSRINIPGTVGPHNWTWRMPVAIESLIERELCKGKSLSSPVGDNGADKIGVVPICSIPVYSGAPENVKGFLKEIGSDGRTVFADIDETLVWPPLPVLAVAGLLKRNKNIRGFTLLARAVWNFIRYFISADERYACLTFSGFSLDEVTSALVDSAGKRERFSAVAPRVRSYIQASPEEILRIVILSADEAHIINAFLSTKKIQEVCREHNVEFIGIIANKLLVKQGIFTNRYENIYPITHRNKGKYIPEGAVYVGDSKDKKGTLAVVKTEELCCKFCEALKFVLQKKQKVSSRDENPGNDGIGQFVDRKKESSSSVSKASTISQEKFFARNNWHYNHYLYEEQQNALKDSMPQIRKVLALLQQYKEERVISRYYITGSLARGDFMADAKDIDFAVSLRQGAHSYGQNAMEIQSRVESLWHKAHLTFDAFGPVYTLKDALVYTGEIRRKEVYLKLSQEMRWLSRLIDAEPLFEKMNNVHFAEVLYQAILSLNKIHNARKEIRDQALFQRKVEIPAMPVKRAKAGSPSSSALEHKIEFSKVYYEAVFPELLTALKEKAAQGAAPVLIIFGLAGAGKTSLAQEFYNYLLSLGYQANLIHADKLTKKPARRLSFYSLLCFVCRTVWVSLRENEKAISYMLKAFVQDDIENKIIPAIKQFSNNSTVVSRINIRLTTPRMEEINLHKGITIIEGSWAAYLFEPLDGAIKLFMNIGTKKAISNIICRDLNPITKNKLLVFAGAQLLIIRQKINRLIEQQDKSADYIIDVNDRMNPKLEKMFQDKRGQALSGKGEKKEISSSSVASEKTEPSLFLLDEAWGIMSGILLKVASSVTDSNAGLECGCAASAVDIIRELREALTAQANFFKGYFFERIP
ncbi:MAG TPA: hypothetical protein DEQ77_06350, partial [Candidatus Omnitrophica bacterium]|nr:hypothetical protein [Candidatus Omnitrophota bacterium]